MSRVASDLKFALRLIAHQPAFAATAVLVLALGIGATAAVFSFVNLLVLRPLPGVRDAGRLVGLYARDTERADTYRGFSYPNYLDIREGTKSLEGVAAFTFGLGGIMENGLTRRSLVMMVSANYFELLGARPVRGRTFSADEEWLGGPTRVAVVSHAYWQRHGGDPALLGRTVSITGHPFTIVGIAPPGFGGTSPVMTPEFWLPLGATRLIENDFIRDIAGGDLASRDTHRFLLFARLKPRTPLAVANADLAAIASRLAETYPAANRGYTIVASELQRVRLAPDPGESGQLSSLSTVLLGMSALVLLVACLNLANMLLARGTARRKEIAIRLALGAGRVALVRQLLVEGFLLAVAGGAVGLIVGHWAMVLLVRSIGPLLPAPVDMQVGLDWRAALAALACAALATTTFALGPALKATRPTVIEELEKRAGDGRRARAAWWFGARNLILGGQVALSLALLVTGALFVRGALRAAAATPGFSLEHGLVVEVDPTLASYSLDESANLHRRALARLRQLPGVEAVSMASLVPFGAARDQVTIERALESTEEATRRAPRRALAEHVSIGADYVRALGLRVIRGREFTGEESEGRQAARVAIIDEPAAARLFPVAGENPVGQLVRLRSGADGRDQEIFEIVGVVPGIRPSLIEAGPRPHVYVPFSARTRASMTYHVRLAAGVSPRVAIPLVHRQLAALDPRLPVLSIRTLESFVQGSAFLWMFRSAARVFTAFGLAALALALVGIYGINAYSVARRSREIGIRMALGATPGQVLRLVVRETAAVTVAGAVAGLALAVTIGSLLASMLFEVSAFDPVALVVAPVLLCGSALVAACVPVRHATRAQVLAALRAD